MSNANFSSPRYWFAHSVVFLLKIYTNIIPWKIQLKIGKKIGKIIYFSKALSRVKSIKLRKYVVKTNLSKCFIEKSNKEIEDLTIKSFESLGITVAESIIAWFMSDKRFKKINFIYCDDFFSNLKSDKKGVLFLSMHSMCLEIIGRKAGIDNNLAIVYQKNKKKFFDHIIYKSRSRYAKCIERKNMIGVIKSLKQDMLLWIAPDQCFSNERGYFIPFFKIPTYTTPSISILSNKSNANINFGFYYRSDKLDCYHIQSYKCFDNFPSENIEDDLRKYNKFVEYFAIKYPDQYLWHHKRFKKQPEGYPSFY